MAVVRLDIRTLMAVSDRQEQLIADQSNSGQVEAWDGNEGAFWTDHALRFDEALADSHRLFLEAAAIRERDRVLDVGCGTGRATRDCARLAAKGFALGVDLSSQMIALAGRTAAAEGLTNIEFRQADAQVEPFEPDSFDVVISRLGSMFFGRPEVAFGNLHRALRPEGRLTLLTWRKLGDNEWLTEFRKAFAVGRDLPTPPADAPGPFAFADPERVTGILSTAGFTDISYRALSEPMNFGSTPDEAFEFVSRFIGWMLEGLDEAGRHTALAALRTSVAGHTNPRGVLYRSATWIVQAHKP